MGQRLYRQLNELLQRVCCPDLNRRRQALQRLGYIRRPRARAALIAALEDPNARIRGTALLALWHGRKPEPEPQVAALLGDPDVHVRTMAAVVAPDLVGKKAAPALAYLLSDPSERVRTFALQGLAACGEASALPAIRPLTRDADPGVRASACYALGVLRDTDSMEALADGASTDIDVAVRYEASRALMALGDARGREGLERLLESGASPEFLDPRAFERDVRRALGEEADWHLPRGRRHSR